MLRLYSFPLLLLTIVLVRCEFISNHTKLTNCKDFCKVIDCEPVKECKDGIILKKKSYCKCCDACVKYLDINQPCKKIMKGSLALVEHSKCKPGSKCENGICVVDTDVELECFHQKAIREKRSGKDKYKNNIWIPQCDKEGNFAAKQMKFRKSVCVDESGKTIFGSASDALQNTCACSRYMQKREENDPLGYNTRPQEHCISSGSFDSLQCINDLCYCADNNTGQVKSNLVRRDYMDKLPCYDSTIHRNNYLTNCEIELQTSRKLAYEFCQKGMKIIGLDRIQCDPDGTFSPTQHLPDKSVCTDKDGIGIGSYHPENKDGEEMDMICDCAREEKYMSKSIFKCNMYGNYDSITCFGSQCVCVDNDGDIISEQPKKDLNSLVCEELRQNLYKMPVDGNDDDDYDDEDYTLYL